MVKKWVKKVRKRFEVRKFFVGTNNSNNRQNSLPTVRGNRHVVRGLIYLLENYSCFRRTAHFICIIWSTVQSEDHTDSIPSSKLEQMPISWLLQTGGSGRA